ncbi:MAG TPA: hypothetical protein VFC61_02285 [Blastocatellia bacterium]|nr:hypothetical protein [Blastocatellia bacterium]
MAYLGLTCVFLALVIVYLLRQGAIREKEWALERGALLQRIQAPEAAVAEHAGRDRPRKPARVIALNDDAAMLKARRRRAEARGEDPDEGA